MSSFKEVGENKKQAMLPEQLDVYRIEHMQLDDVRFAKPYAMRVGLDRRLWLDSTHDTVPEETPKYCLMITCTLMGLCVTVQDDPEAGWDLETEESLLEDFGDVEWLPVAAIFDPRGGRL